MQVVFFSDHAHEWQRDPPVRCFSWAPNRKRPDDCWSGVVGLIVFPAAAAVSAIVIVRTNFFLWRCGYITTAQWMQRYVAELHEHSCCRWFHFLCVVCNCRQLFDGMCQRCAGLRGSSNQQLEQHHGMLSANESERYTKLHDYCGRQFVQTDIDVWFKHHRHAAQKFQYVCINSTQCVPNWINFERNVGYASRNLEQERRVERKLQGTCDAYGVLG